MEPFLHLIIPRSCDKMTKNGGVGMYRRWYRFADTVFLMDSAMPIRTQGELWRFQIPAQPEDCRIRVEFAQPEQTLCNDYRRAGVERSGNQIRVFFDENCYPEPSDQQIFGLIPFASLLLERDTFILHASYIRYRDEAILFSGPSGIGKSTQAALWETHRGAEVINGDRVLIFWKDGRYYAGSHFLCGSSGVCRNVNLPIRAVVLLAQGTENRVAIPRGAEVFQRLSQQILSLPHDHDWIDAVAELASQVDICTFVCTADERAVECLQRYLYEQ